MINWTSFISPPMPSFSPSTSASNPDVTVPILPSPVQSNPNIPRTYPPFYTLPKSLF
ncbi:hypothetical protein B6N60_00318 [Richelia sinica FACHB-800]|uniref:Uncharacterized protein n=1 Tax=Richelia sinica FACHB-800 TaxID=1357546 RepID=A0A975T585_9NOST|nr:hypothetical protein [Richelia sinica]MBD2665870.1 hypothetical protein [Richelia sinica FACHB-800]QXE21641.1 hypothetical protein B6N60_00318 [Richelia sinica FACHB-800]